MSRSILYSIGILSASSSTRNNNLKTSVSTLAASTLSLTTTSTLSWILKHSHGLFKLSKGLCCTSFSLPLQANSRSTTLMSFQANSQPLATPLRPLRALLKGQCHEIFCFWFFSWISFPQASDYTFRADSNFFENLRSYSQLNVCHRCQRHRWQMEKTYKQKNINNFVWTPLGSRGNIYIIFCPQVHF